MGRLANGMRKVQEEQLRHLFEDHAESLRQLARFTPPVTVWFDHMSRTGGSCLAGLARRHGRRDRKRRRGRARRMRARGGTRAQGAKADAERDLIDRLLKDHRRLSRVLDVMEKLAGTQRPDELDLLGSAVDYIAEYPDAYHHPREDQLFERLLDREISDAERQAIGRLEAGHAELRRKTEGVVRQFDEVLDTETIDTTALDAAIGEYLDAQRAHMKSKRPRSFR